jgi:DnaJ-class molecular chaperone
MSAIKETGPKPGTRTCPDCDGEGIIWHNLVHFICERCLGAGWIRL